MIFVYYKTTMLSALRKLTAELTVRDYDNFEKKLTLKNVNRFQEHLSIDT